MSSVCSWCEGSGLIEDTQGCLWPCFCGIEVEEVEWKGQGGPVESTHSNQWTLVSIFLETQQNGAGRICTHAG